MYALFFMAAIALGAVVAIALVVIIALTLARRQSASQPPAAAAPDEFASLSEPERCDFVFALGALDDPSAMRLLERALEDPCEAVAVAAAHALVGAGRRERLEHFLASSSGERSQRIAATLALLD